VPAKLAQSRRNLPRTFSIMIPMHFVLYIRPDDLRDKVGYPKRVSHGVSEASCASAWGFGSIRRRGCCRSDARDLHFEVANRLGAPLVPSGTGRPRP
jgi:hypothetical protein